MRIVNAAAVVGILTGSPAFGQTIEQMFAVARACDAGDDIAWATSAVYIDRMNRASARMGGIAAWAGGIGTSDSIRNSGNVAKQRLSDQIAASPNRMMYKEYMAQAQEAVRLGNDQEARRMLGAAVQTCGG